MADETARKSETRPGNDAAPRTSSQRVGSGLDVHTALEPAVENDGALTGACYGIIATVDDSG